MGIIQTHITWRKLQLSGSSRSKREYKISCSTLFGDGEIASLVGKLANCKTWGCEIFPYQAEKAAAHMDDCHSSAWESCSLTDESITLLWINLPYDDDRYGNEMQLERKIIRLLSLSTSPDCS